MNNLTCTPLFSIVIPTYNRANVLTKTIESVIAQTFSDWELIVVDDGSTDDTREVLIPYLIDSRIKYIYQENKERSVARNNGILNSKGQFICFLDSDDAYLSNHLQCLYKLIEGKNFEIAMYVTNVVRNEFGKTVEVPVDNVSGYFNTLCYILLTRESIIPSRVCIHNKILSEHKFDESLKDVEDTVLWVQIANSFPVVQTSERTVLYFIHDNNSTNRKNNPFLNQLKGLKKIFNDPELKKNIPQKVIREKMSRCYSGIGNHYLDKKEYFGFAVNNIKAILQDPFSKSAPNKIYLLFRYFPLAISLTYKKITLKV